MAMQEINALVIRLENGLTNSVFDIPSANWAILEFLAGKGVILGISSRFPVERIFSYMKKQKKENLFSFMIGTCGSEYLNVKTGQKTNLFQFTHQDLEQFKTITQTMPLSYGVWNGHGFTFSKPGLTPLLYGARRYKPVGMSGFSGLPADQTYSKLLVTGASPVLDRFAQHLEATRPDLQAFRAGRHMMDILPSAIDPSSPLALAQRDFGFDLEHTMSFSSQLADAKIMDKTIPVAMKNSPDPILEKAIRTTKYNAAQNGFAYMINMFMMENAYVFKAPKSQRTQ